MRKFVKNPNVPWRQQFFSTPKECKRLETRGASYFYGISNIKGSSLIIMIEFCSFKGISAIKKTYNDAIFALKKKNNKIPLSL